jgi:predicted nucleic-acid-binding protein
MIGLDTNVLVRYLTKDDPAQTPIAVRVVRSLSSENPGFVSLVAAAELVWVLRISYGYERAEISRVLENLLQSQELVFEQAEVLDDAVRSFAAGNADFADFLIERSGHSAGCAYTATFDKRAASAGMKLLK